MGIELFVLVCLTIVSMILCATFLSFAMENEERNNGPLTAMYAAFFLMTLVICIVLLVFDILAAIKVLELG